MSEGGLLAVAGTIVSVVTCGLVAGALTNRHFGHSTFFSPNPGDTIICSNDTSNDATRSSSVQRQSSGTRDAALGDTSTNGYCSRSSNSNHGNTHSRVGFSDLPLASVVIDVLSYLSPADLARAASTCPVLAIACSNEMLWHAHCCRVFGGGGGMAGALGPVWLEAQHRYYEQEWDVRPSKDEGKKWTLRSPFSTTVSPRGTGVLRASSGQRVSDETSGGSPRPRHDETSAQESPRYPHVRVKSPRIHNDSGNNDSREHDLSGTRNSCYCERSWRGAFFFAHRAYPRRLLSDACPASSCVVMVHGRVHDLTNFLVSHPGGELILREHASTDATLAFERFFHSRAARRIAKSLVVWDGERVMGRRGTLWRVSNGFAVS